jgi:hypothetical protein
MKNEITHNHISRSILQLADGNVGLGTSNIGLGTSNINWHAFSSEKEVLERWVGIAYMVKNCTFETHFGDGIQVHKEAEMDAAMDDGWQLPTFDGEWS